MSEPPGSMAALNGVHELTADAAPCSLAGAPRGPTKPLDEPR